jgi:integrase
MKLTNATVRALPLPPTGNKVHYDDDLPGYGARVTAAGVKAFVITYRVRSTQRQRTMTIGRCDVWAEGAARREAKRLKQLVDQGQDPLGEIHEERALPTVNELADRFLAEHVVPKTRPSTAKTYKGHIRRHVRPTFGARKVTDVTTEDVERLQARLTKECGPIGANRTLATVTTMFSQAVRWRLREDNPCAGVGRNKENKRKRYLKGDELPRLLAALSGYRTPRMANVIRVLMMTGARSGEVLAMRWADLDLTGGTWLKPAETVKQGEDHHAPLSAPLCLLLSEIAAEQKKMGITSEWVFPTRTGAHTRHEDLWKAWQEICQAANLVGVKPHDLRHDFASRLVSAGASLPLIGALLGHSNQATTQRYAHLQMDPLRAAVEKVGQALVNSRRESADAPVPMRGGRRGR